MQARKRFTNDLLSNPPEHVYLATEETNFLQNHSLVRFSPSPSARIKAVPHPLTSQESTVAIPTHSAWHEEDQIFRPSPFPLNEPALTPLFGCEENQAGARTSCVFFTSANRAHSRCESPTASIWMEHVYSETPNQVLCKPQDDHAQDGKSSTNSKVRRANPPGTPGVAWFTKATYFLNPPAGSAVATEAGTDRCNGFSK